MPTDGNKSDLECYYYVIEDGSTYTGPENTMQLNFGGTTGTKTYNVKDAEEWRAYKDAWRPTLIPNKGTFFYNGDATNQAITYSNSAGWNGTESTYTNNNNNYGGGSKYYKLHTQTLLDDSLELTDEL